MTQAARRTLARLAVPGDLGVTGSSVTVYVPTAEAPRACVVDRDGSASHVIMGVEGSGTLTVRDGGMVEAWNFRSEQRAQSSRLNVDNGTLRLVRDQSELFNDMPAGSIQVGPGNMTIDTQGFTVQTATSAPGIEGAGGLTKAGSGTLTSGETLYGIYYNAKTHQCVQLANANDRVDSAVDIYTHPKCK
jgi:hypothetical protein